MNIQFQSLKGYMRTTEDSSKQVRMIFPTLKYTIEKSYIRIIHNFF